MKPPHKINSLEDIRIAKQQAKLDIEYTERLLFSSLADMTKLVKKTVYDEGLKEALFLLSSRQASTTSSVQSKSSPPPGPTANQPKYSPWVNFVEEVLPNVLYRNDD